MRSANGAIILVLGILSFVGFGPLTGIPAWIMGNQSLAQIERGEADPGESGIVQAGRLLGMIATLLFAAGMILFLLFVLGFFGLLFRAGSN